MAQTATLPTAHGASHSRGLDKDRKLHVVVVGGSLGGLFAGISLVRQGHNVVILERSRSQLLHNQGAGIVAGGDTLAFFEKYDRCRHPLAVTSQRRMYLDRHGHVVHQVQMRQNMTSWDLAYHLLRANFDGIQSDYCAVPQRESSDGIATHLHGHTLTGLEDCGDAVRVTFNDAHGTQDSMTADLVVGADGPSSTVRQLLCPGTERDYAGYCALRGTVPENEVSEAARAAFCERFTFFHGPGRQILAYLIPGPNGTTRPGERLVNFVYYTNFPAGSTALEELMTDATGARHRLTMPPGQLAEDVWERQRELAAQHLPPQFAEIVRATKRPFVQLVTDLAPAPACAFMGAKVVLVGDALAGFRPHTVASTSQAAFDAMGLADMVQRGGLREGEAAVRVKETWRAETMAFARLVQKRGVDMGRRSQFEDLPLEEHIKDRDAASMPREREVYPNWVKAV